MSALERGAGLGVIASAAYAGFEVLLQNVDMLASLSTLLAYRLAPELAWLDASVVEPMAFWFSAMLFAVLAGRLIGRVLGGGTE